MIQTRVDRVGIDLQTDQPVVMLSDPMGRRILPIWIGPLEASAIALEMEGVKPPRPMTHDLLKNILDVLGAQVSMVLINDLQEGTFYAQIVLKVADKNLTADARPSDAIALALRTKARIFVEEKVMEDASIRYDGDQLVQ
ncbi:MAG: bifunctional nuclease family protein [Firmicutes bacterium]|nr:bifunctional nuclease family protein [Bacillota bacterium]MCL5040841.1 bifunctional nuclease family protein [Bacillota bacterium]